MSKRLNQEREAKLQPERMEMENIKLLPAPSFPVMSKGEILIAREKIEQEREYYAVLAEMERLQKRLLTAQKKLFNLNHDRKSYEEYLVSMDHMEMKFNSYNRKRNI